MNVSAKTEYACIAVLELALHYFRGEPVRLRSISGSHGIPSYFLVQILLQLKAAGLVTSTRGAGGGYRLSKDPANITLGEVMSVVDAKPEKITNSSSVDSANSRTLLSAWEKVAAAQRQMLDAVTFAELADRVRRDGENMYYI